MTTTEALSILTLAIQNVRPCYIKIDAIPGCDTKKIQVERSFAYELYHQWSLLLEACKGLNPTVNNLRLNGEITKQLDLNSRSYPDMILHGGQESLENQILVCEIKRVDGAYPDSKGILDDLKKLSQFLHLVVSHGSNKIDAHYSAAVFIVANIGRAELENKIKNSLADEVQECSNIRADSRNIHCISVDVINQEKLDVSHFTLEEII